MSRTCSPAGRPTGGGDGGDIDDSGDGGDGGWVSLTWRRDESYMVVRDEPGMVVAHDV